jgi:hypothetical protein
MHFDERPSLNGMAGCGVCTTYAGRGLAAALQLAPQASTTQPFQRLNTFVICNLNRLLSIDMQT